MIDDSICYLLHDMRGYNYRLAKGGEATPPPTPRLSPTAAWLNSILEGESFWELWDYLQDTTYSPSSSQEFLVRNSVLQNEVRPYSFEMQDYCGCDNCVDEPTSDLDKSFGWGHFVAIDFGSGVKISLYSPDYKLSEITQLFDEDLRIPRIRRASTRLLPMDRQVCSDSNQAMVLSNLWSQGEIAYWSDFGAGTYSTMQDSEPISFRIPGGVGIHIAMPGSMTVSDGCALETRNVTLNNDWMAEHNIRSLMPYALGGMCILYEGLLTGRGPTSLRGVRRLISHFHHDIFTELSNVYARISNSSADIEPDEILSLETFRHSAADCDICNEREEFDGRTAADNIAALIRS